MTPMEELGARVRAARVEQRYGVKAAAEGAGISRDTWKRVEQGLGVQDVKRAAALRFLGLDHTGSPVGGDTQDADYVAAPGDRSDDDPVTSRELREELRAIRTVLERMEERDRSRELPGS